MNLLKDLMTVAERRIYEHGKKPQNIKILRRVLDRKLLEDPGYEGFIELQIYRGSNRKSKAPLFLEVKDCWVSNKGRVYSTRGNLGPRFLILKLNKQNGYYYIQLSINNKNRAMSLHRVLCSLFVYPKWKYRNTPLNDLLVNHIDCDRTNYDLNNLEWTDDKGNTDHMHSLDRGMGVPVKGIVLKGPYLGYTFGLKHASYGNKFGFESALISHCVRGTRNKHRNCYFEKTTLEELNSLPLGIPRDIFKTLV